MATKSIGSAISPDSLLATEGSGLLNLIDFIGPMLSILWGDWLPNNMKLMNGGEDSFRLGGKCPYPQCGLESVFFSVTSPYVEREPAGGYTRLRLRLVNVLVVAAASWES